MTVGLSLWIVFVDRECVCFPFLSFPYVRGFDKVVKCGLFFSCCLWYASPLWPDRNQFGWIRLTCLFLGSVVDRVNKKRLRQTVRMWKQVIGNHWRWCLTRNCAVKNIGFVELGARVLFYFMQVDGGLRPTAAWIHSISTSCVGGAFNVRELQQTVISSRWLKYRLNDTSCKRRCPVNVCRQLLITHMTQHYRPYTAEQYKHFPQSTYFTCASRVIHEWGQSVEENQEKANSRRHNLGWFILVGRPHEWIYRATRGNSRVLAGPTIKSQFLYWRVVRFGDFFDRDFMYYKSWISAK